VIMYYGSKISDNMTKTPEGYLICHNVPIGRTGSMDYLGEEIGLQDKRGQRIKVYRKPEELFSKATIASFEGKPTTNNHPTQNIDLNTVGMLTRGHAENIRQDGDFLLADLYITDAGLIAEIENGKREVSCGYDCLWVPVGENEYEQKEIVGNHVAVVQNGRAGTRVAIKDSMPEKINDNERSNKKMPKVTNKFLAALGFKHYVADAEPEEIAKAMDALSEEEGIGANPDSEADGTEKIMSAIAQLGEAIKGLTDRVTALEESDKKVHEEVGADAELEGLEKELETKDEEGSGTVEPEEKKEEEKEEDKKPAADSALKKFVQDMKPIIMAIPDEKARNAAAKQFSQTVRDARASGANGYGDIVSTVAGHKKQAMDTKQVKSMSQAEATAIATEAWNKNNAHYKEVK